LENGLGLSSLERVELISALEDRYQIDLGETNFATIATVGDLERLIQGQRSSRRGLESGAAGQDKAAPPPELVSTGHLREFQFGSFHYPRWALRWPITWIRTAVRYLLAKPAMLVRAWPRVIGRENLRSVRGPVLVVSNHVSDVDIAFVQTALPAHLRGKLATATGGEALEKLRSPSRDRMWIFRIYDQIKWALAVALLNLFPLPRNAGFRKSFAYAGEAVDRGYSILVFPEGRHTTDGRLQPFRSGVGLLANNLRIPVVPMRIDGLFEIKKAGKKFARKGKIQVRIGKPTQFAPETDAAEIARFLQQEVERL
jgi:long-chain acyl-CoA synthetase